MESSNAGGSTIIENKKSGYCACDSSCDYIRRSSDVPSLAVQFHVEWVSALPWNTQLDRRLDDVLSPHLNKVGPE